MYFYCEKIPKQQYLDTVGDDQIRLLRFWVVPNYRTIDVGHFVPVSGLREMGEVLSGWLHQPLYEGKWTTFLLLTRT